MAICRLGFTPLQQDVSWYVSQRIKHEVCDPNAHRRSQRGLHHRQGRAKDFWQKIGRACPNDDGSWNVYLNALPLTGVLNIRDPKPRRDAEYE